MEEGRHWYPFRDSRIIADLIAKTEAEERDRREWIEDVKRRLGIHCIGDEPPHVIEWPALDYVGHGCTYSVVSEHAMASRDGVNFYVKPDGVPLAEWWASLP